MATAATASAMEAGLVSTVDEPAAEGVVRVVALLVEALLASARRRAAPP